jgi:hypothetical protein
MGQYGVGAPLEGAAMGVAAPPTVAEVRAVQLDRLAP